MFSPKYKIIDPIPQNLSKIETLRERITSSRLLPKYEAEIRERSTVEATRSSVSIEGNLMDFNQVQDLLTKQPKLSKTQYREIEIRNYKFALDFIADRKKQLSPLSPQDILRLHKIITKDLLDNTRAGKWRQNPVYVENGRHQVLYEAVSPNRVPIEIENLLDWLNTDGAGLSPVIAAGILHLQFVSIHPFADGNGRTARALTMLYLGLRAYDFRGSIVLDSYYAANRQEYYNSLNSAQGKTYAESQEKDITDWLIYFSEGFLSSAKVLDTEIRLIRASAGLNMKALLSTNEKTILDYVQAFESISLSEAEDVLPDCSRRTIQRILKGMVDDGLLILTGSTHHARYVQAKSREKI